MKRLFSIIAVTLLLMAGAVSARPVDNASARKAACAFLRALGQKSAPGDLVDVTAATPFANFYIFSLNGGEGFIIISADDNTEPVLAYSLHNAFVADAIPPQVMAWLYGYEMEVAQNSVTVAPQATRQQWEELFEGRALPSAKAGVEPMLSTQWNQSPYYNALCPYDSTTGGRVVCGCTATATAQIMKYFNHPAQGYGSCTYTSRNYGDLSADYGSTMYLWDSMPDVLDASSTQGQVDAVATLIYHVGVSVSMDYSVGGSAGKTASYGYGGEASSENAFKYNFKYSPYVWTAFRIDYTLNEWKELMKNELNQGRPILYAGYDEIQSGHAFVCDGYTSYGTFHFNWGWGGTYDGFFKLNNLNPGSYYHFDLFATATVGVEPFDGFDPSSTTTVTTGVEALGGVSLSDGVVTGAGTYSFGDTITLSATSVSDNVKFVQWSDGCKYNPRSTVATGGEVSFTAQFAPVMDDTVRYHTCDNAMNRATNVPHGLGEDSVWGIRIPASALKPGCMLNAVRFMGRKEAEHTLTVYSGVDTPQDVLYTSVFVDSLEYPYTFHTHQLSSPVAVDASKSLWIVLKCTAIDTPGVFSIFGGNPNSMLSGVDLTPMSDQWKFSWMIEGIFSGNVGVDVVEHSVSKAVEVFPNPAGSTVTIAGLDGLDDALVELFDMYGRIRYSRSVRQSIPSQSPLSASALGASALDANSLGANTYGAATSAITLDVSTLAPGAYLLRVKTRNVVSSTKLVIAR